MTNLPQNSQMLIYQTESGRTKLDVRLDGETVWLDAHQIARLFDVDRTGVVRHIKNVYKSGELKQKTTCAKIAQVAQDRRVRQMDFYNLDMIISVGYRVNSKQATNFRIWATQILKQYIVQGYAINQRRLIEAMEKFKELQEMINFIHNKSQTKLLKNQTQELFNLLSSYNKTFSVLEKYDKGKLTKPRGRKSKFTLKYKDCLKAIKEIREELVRKKEARDLFGKERQKSLESIVSNLYQTFNKKELYPTLESKAVHLFYLIIKDHPFSDGNKRIAAFLFVYFLDKNNYLYKKSGEKKINDNALVALALLIAQSDPREKDILIRLVMNLIVG